MYEQKLLLFQSSLKAHPPVDANKVTHDEVAREASQGYGGVYRLLRAPSRLREARFSTWVRKPDNMTYRSIFEELYRLPGGAFYDLWQRQMVLGQAPEFCLHAEKALDLPRRLRPVEVRLRLVEEDGP